jgi:hypothetical protein
MSFLPTEEDIIEEDESESATPQHPPRGDVPPVLGFLFLHPAPGK